MRILFLDDDPRRHEEFARIADGHSIVHVWRVDEAKAYLDRMRFDLCCLDNDLATEAFGREGYEVAEYIAAAPRSRRPARVLIHSWNETRARDMYTVLSPFYGERSLTRIRFGEFETLTHPSGPQSS